MQTIRQLLKMLQKRDEEAHKGTFGLVLLICGSRGMTGAAVLAGRAALRAGAGLVCVAVPESCQMLVASMQPEYMTSPLPEDASGKITYAAKEAILELARRATVVAIGPGLGQSDDLFRLIPELWAELDVPMILDADALNALAQWGKKLPQPPNTRIITPHPGEFHRLCGNPTVLDNRIQRIRAVRWASENQAIVVLKGAGTLITDGENKNRNTTGNPGMATGGAGDVLTGILAGVYAQMIRQEMTPFDIARLAVWVHGKSGDLAARKLGQTSLIASDLIDFLPDAIQND
ncbi:MAG: NAD(P)H-hydrate dehydratase [Planctomycetia bacterium]|nr:NAD(P)H-hydrate dehydratase [Planctomycetia bacterium]